MFHLLELLRGFGFRLFRLRLDLFRRWAFFATLLLFHVLARLVNGLVKNAFHFLAAFKPRQPPLKHSQQ